VRTKTINRKRVERPKVYGARPGPTRTQPGEVCVVVGIAGHDLAIEHGRLRSQLMQQLRDGREPDKCAPRQIRAATAECTTEGTCARWRLVSLVGLSIDNDGTRAAYEG
jgi:hypothetical protein